jgi:hypothetical protein
MSMSMSEAHLYSTNESNKNGSIADGHNISMIMIHREQHATGNMS